ncbi:fasciclin domain-containing protein [Lutimonas zeaxanthinifaciens]|uniref:fasciclin domain-containing protein n=1 Tax=Lutimonas zeaxanthinifaciens TaxID=3060215 RepID=UPI00265CEC8C|nr:fasciclin domain-containing protein [Lutimonas sp. YSD2104]WKK65195.1 fasciclin domain-containing protein [Lutimonas sp. YSD2104]
MKNLIQHLNYLPKAMMLVLVLSFAFTTQSCDDDDDDMIDPGDQNIVEVVSGRPDLSTLTGAVVAAGLDEALAGPGPFTVFAPTNAAFNSMDQDILNNVIANPSLLTALLQYHVVSGEVESGDLSNGPVQTLLSGQTIDVDLSDGVVLNGSADVTTADVPASNGVIHIINEVLIPEDFVTNTLAQIVAGSPDHTILLSALGKPELGDLLAAANDPTQDLTVFAPTDAAFEAVLGALEKESIDEIPVGLLKEIVTYHILGGAVTSDQLSNGDVNTLLPGIPGGPEFEFVTVDITDGVKINSANVTAADIKAVNGVAHVVDAVLLPSYVAYSVGTIAEPVLFENDFTVLSAALRKAELLETVATTADLTVFAPTNAGFVAAGITSLDGLEKEDLTPVLTYHVLGAVVKAADLPESGIAATLNGENIYLGYSANVLINGLTTITAVDIEKSNGVVHVIDRTLIPPAPNVVEIALALADNGDASEFTILTSLLANEAYADITQAIIDAENITIFAPTDAAFEDIADIIPTLSEDQIRTILTYHAAGARVFSYNLVDGQEVIMLNTQTLKVNINNDGVFLEDKSAVDAEVIIVNVHGSNGVIHAVDKVLIPEL